MINVTFLTGEYPPMQGGIADHTAHLAEHMAPLGVMPSVLISQAWQETPKSINEDPADITPGNSTSPYVYASLPNWGWRCWPAISSFLKTHQPDVLHIQYQAAAFDLQAWVNWLPWYLKRRGIKTCLVTTFHDLRVPYIFPKAGPFRWRSILALARHSDANICTNREDLQTVQHSLNVVEDVNLTRDLSHNSPARLPPRSSAPLLTLIPLGSNVEPQPPADFDRVAWRKKYNLNADTFLLAYFGFLNESKGGEELIEVLALLRQQGLDTHLLLIGGDVGQADPTNISYAERVQQLINRHELTHNVHRTGYTDLSQVSANLLAADVVVMPYRDGVSFRRTTLIAALRHGCPVVSTSPADPVLVPEIRSGVNMLLAPPCDAPALAQAVARLASNTDLRHKLAAGAKQLGELFEWENIARETVGLYRAVTRISD